MIKQLTVICPVYQEQDTITFFYQRVTETFRKISQDYQIDLLFIDNNSSDKSREIIKKIADQNPQVYLISLSRNVGYQKSIECGLKNAKGDLFIIIDVDCEDPPEMIPNFLSGYEEGYDIVYGERQYRDEENFILRFVRRQFYRITKALSDDNFILDMAEFSLMTAEVRDAIVNDNNSFPFIRSSIGRVGFSIKGIKYKRQQRIAGVSHYNIIGMFIFALAGILSSSTLLLRLPAYIFPFWLLAIIGIGIWQISFPSFSSIPLILSLGFAFCGFSLTAISIYVARIYKNAPIQG